MKIKWNLQKGCLAALAAYAALVSLFYWIGGEQLQKRVDIEESISPSASVGEILSDTVLEQSFSVRCDRLTDFSVLAGTFGRGNSGTLAVDLYVQDPQSERELAERFWVDVSQLQDGGWLNLRLTHPLDTAGKTFLLSFSSQDGSLGNAVTLYYGSSIAAGRVEVQKSDWIPLYKNGQPLEGTLCLKTTGETNLWFGRYYWYIFAGAGVLLAAYCWRLCSDRKSVV